MYFEGAGDVGGMLGSESLLFAVARNAVRFLTRRGSVAGHEPITEIADSRVLKGMMVDLVEFVSRQQELALPPGGISALPTRCREVLLLRKIQGLAKRNYHASSHFPNTVETRVAVAIMA